MDDGDFVAIEGEPSGVFGVGDVDGFEIEFEAAAELLDDEAGGGAEGQQDLVKRVTLFMGWNPAGDALELAMGLRAD